MVFAIMLNASSTFVEFFADVSMNGIDRLSANSYSVRSVPISDVKTLVRY